MKIAYFIMAHHKPDQLQRLAELVVTIERWAAAGHTIVQLVIDGNGFARSERW